MRALRIELIEEKDGRKRVAHRTFEATAILLLDPPTAGEGFLALARSMAQELDGARKTEDRGPKTGPRPQNHAETLVPSNPPTPVELTPERLAEIAQITTKRRVGKKGAAA